MDSNAHEAVSLASDAIDMMATDPDAAVWRLVDAALMAWRAAGEPEGLIGRDLSTGRGARLVLDDDLDQVIP